MQNRSMPMFIALGTILFVAGCDSGSASKKPDAPAAAKPAPAKHEAAPAHPATPKADDVDAKEDAEPEDQDVAPGDEPEEEPE